MAIFEIGNDSLWLRPSSAAVAKFESQPVVPIDPRVGTELSWGNQPLENLYTMGTRGRMILTAEGRQVAVDNLDHWQQELLNEGEECTSLNLMEKYEQASSGCLYADNVSALVKSSIRLRIKNLGRGEKAKAKKLAKSAKTPESTQANGPMAWRAERIPEETLSLWQKLQHLAIACNDLRWESIYWSESHPSEMNNAKLALAVAALGMMTGLAVVFGTKWLSELKISFLP